MTKPTTMNLQLLYKVAKTNKHWPHLQNILVRPGHDHVTLTAYGSDTMASLSVPCQSRRTEPYAITTDDLKHHAKMKSADPFEPLTKIRGKDFDKLLDPQWTPICNAVFLPEAADYPAASVLEAEFAISTDETRYALTGTYLGEGKIVATNGRCLFISENPDPVHSKPIIVPDSKAMRAFNRMAAKTGKAFIQVSEHDKKTFIRLSCGRWTLIVKAIEANFPNYVQVIPTTSRVSVQFNPQHMLEAIDSLPFHLLRSEQFYFRIRNGISHIVMLDADGREYARNLFCQSDTWGRPLDISFNAEFVRSALKHGFNKMDGIDDLSAGVFRRTDDPRNARIIIMPMRMQAAQPAKAA